MYYGGRVKEIIIIITITITIRIIIDLLAGDGSDLVKIFTWLGHDVLLRTLCWNVTLGRVFDWNFLPLWDNLSRSYGAQKLTNSGKKGTIITSKSSFTEINLKVSELSRTQTHINSKKKHNAVFLQQRCRQATGRWSRTLVHAGLTEDVDVSVGECVAVLVAGIALNHHQIISARWTVVFAQVLHGHRQTVVTPAELVRRRVVGCITIITVCLF